MFTHRHIFRRNICDEGKLNVGTIICVILKMNETHAEKESKEAIAD